MLGHAHGSPKALRRDMHRAHPLVGELELHLWDFEPEALFHLFMG